MVLSDLFGKWTSRTNTARRGWQRAHIYVNVGPDTDPPRYCTETNTLDDLRGGDADANGLAIHGLLDGAPGPFRDIVLYNAGAALVVAGKVDDHTAGVALAVASIDDGAARAKLEALVRITNEDAP